MDKLPRYVIWIVFVIITVIVIGIFTYNEYNTEPSKNSNSNTTKVSDSKKFKDEYESINNKEIDGHKMIELSINEKNPIYYASLSDIKKLKNAVILFGNPEDGDTRNLIPTLFSVADSRGLSTIYYLQTSENNKKELKDILDIDINNTELIIIKDSKVIYQSKGLGIEKKDKYTSLSDSEKEALARVIGENMDKINPGICDEAC